MSEILFSRDMCDTTDMFEDRKENQYYRALMALKPADLTANAWTSRAQVNRSFFSDLKFAKGAPTLPSLEKLLTQIGYSIDDLQQYLDDPSAIVAARPAVQPRGPRAATMEFRGPDRPRDVPVLGMSECAEGLEVTVDGEKVLIEALDLDYDEVVDHVKRPVALDWRADVYAIYQSGYSLAPKFEPGEPSYVDPKRPPQIGDYVVVQLRAPDEQSGERIIRVITKRLVRNTSAFVELEQFNPPLIFRLARKDVGRMHRIIPWAELVAF